jgi:septal ring factor EnvC (AmiA/AmiB activator)
MNKAILIFVVLLAGMLTQTSAQDVAVLDEKIKRLTGHVQDLQDDSANLKRQIEALVKENQALREQLQAQPKTPGASLDEVRELARKIQEVDEKRLADRRDILNEINDLGRTLANQVRNAARSPRDVAADSPRNAANLPSQALEHTISPGDTLLAISLAYSKETGKKITTDLILKANPGLKPERLIPGRKILVPVPDK